MALRAVKPQEVKKRFKTLFYGVAGVGKTMAAIQFPKPYIIDTEGSTGKKQYVEAIKKTEGAVFQTQDFDELLSEVKSLLTIKHDYKTLVIDSLTVLYNDLLDKAEKKVGSEFGRHYNEANKKMKILLNFLFRIDMNVIITTHSKNLYSKDEKEMVLVGQTFDCYKQLDYLFDLVFEIQKRAKSRVCIVKKSRIESFPEGASFPFDYNEISKRYGMEIMEKEPESEKWASKEQIDRLKELIELYKEPQEVIDKWLTKANAESFEEMNEEIVKKLIIHMENKVKPKSEVV